MHILEQFRKQLFLQTCSHLIHPKDKPKGWFHWCLEFSASMPPTLDGANQELHVFQMQRCIYRCIEIHQSVFTVSSPHLGWLGWSFFGEHFLNHRRATHHWPHLTHSHRHTDTDTHTHTHTHTWEVVRSCIHSEHAANRSYWQMG